MYYACYLLSTLLFMQYGLSIFAQGGAAHAREGMEGGKAGAERAGYGGDAGASLPAPALYSV